MSRKNREREYQMELAHKAILEEEARASYSVKTQSFIKPKTLNQACYVKSIKRNTITIAAGEAGVGKSLLALHTAIEMLNNPNNDTNKIYYLRANVGMEDERELGFLPGDLQEKIAPLAYPVLDNLIQFMDENQAKYFMQSEKIEVLPIAMIRGRSFANSFIFCDEVQNLSVKGFRTVLSRISTGSTMVLAGDYSQTDIKQENSGFKYVINKLNNMPEVGVIEFNRTDIIRHPIIANILERIS